MTQWTVTEWKRLGGLQTIRDDMPDDLFVTCASDEERTTFAVENLTPNYRAKKGVIYVNEEVFRGVGVDTEEDRTPLYLQGLSQLLRGRCDEICIAQGSWIKVEVQLKALKEELVAKNPELPSDAAITLDTTTFNRDALLTTVTLLRTYRPGSLIRAVYTSPREHGEWLTEGFRGVRNVMGFTGIQKPSQPTLLIVLSGFESERTLQLMEQHEPVKVLLGIGNPPVAPSFLQRNVAEQQVILAQQEVETFEFPTGNIAECSRCLEAIVQDYLGSYNLVIAPMSTKLSTLGVLLVAERYREIQITYCVPGKYNTVDYSTGVERFYVEVLPVVGTDDKPE